MRRDDILTIDQILRWADMHHARNGSWPQARDGAVFGAIDENWKKLARNLWSGARGLPKGTTLARLLAERRGARCPASAPPLSLPAILAWADAYSERTGKWPSAESGPIPEASGENWSMVHMALVKGFRGLPGGSSLPRLLLEERGAPIRRPKRGSIKFTVEQVLRWADAHRARHGQWPRRESGVIPEAAPRTWKRINAALRHGHFGLPGGASLREFLRARRNVRTGWVRRLDDKPPLSVEQILDWAKAHRQATGGWPHRLAGKIGGVAGESWLQVDRVLSLGKRGLPGGQTLAVFLRSRIPNLARPVRRPGGHASVSPSRGPRLKKAAVLAWADAHFQRHGAWPNPDSGPIPEAPGETWCGVDGALLKGRRGLSKSSLARLLVEERGMRSKRYLPRLSPKKIVALADRHRERHGRWPTRKSGPVSGSPGDTWNAIDSALQRGRRGLAGGSSLPQLLEKERGQLRPKSRQPLSVLQILVWADSYHRREGEWPKRSSGIVADAGDGTTWHAVDLALMNGSRGLKGDSSLPRLLAERRGVPNRLQAKKLSVAAILSWADSHQRRTGDWPNLKSGRVAESLRDTWQNLDVCLRIGGRGLAGGSSLSRLLSDKRAVPHRLRRPSLSVEQILDWADRHRQRTGRWPTRASGQIHEAPDESWMSVNDALRRGARGLPGGRTLSQLLAEPRGNGIHVRPTRCSP